MSFVHDFVTNAQNKSKIFCTIDIIKQRRRLLNFNIASDIIIEQGGVLSVHQVANPRDEVIPKYISKEECTK